MIAQYFEENLRLIVQGASNQQPISGQTWVYGDNYYLQIYLVSAGVIQPISSSDTIALMLFQPSSTNPQTNLAIVGSPVVLTDSQSNQYYQIKVSLLTTQIAALVQTPNTSIQAKLHFVFSPADGERFSSSSDVVVTINPDPLQSASGATPAPAGYPPSSSVFELIANKNAASGYAGLDATSKLTATQIPIDATLAVVAGKLSVVAGSGTGDMTKAVYDTANRGYVNRAVLADSATAVALSGVTGAGTAAGLNVPASGNASTAQVVKGDDTRLSDSRTPVAHSVSHKSGGSDSIAIDTLAAATDITALNASATAHGLLLKLSNTGAKFLRDDGTWQAVTGATGNPFLTTVLTFTIPAKGSTVGVTVASNADLVINQSAVITDGTLFISCVVTAISGTSITVLNLGVGGAVTGTMGAAHWYVGSAPKVVSTTLDGLAPVLPNDATRYLDGTGAYSVPTSSGSALNINAKVHKSTDIAIPSGGLGNPAAGTMVSFDATDFNNGGVFSSGTPTRLTAPSTGIYLIVASAVFNPNITTGMRTLSLYKNSVYTSRVALSLVAPMDGGGTNNTTASIQSILNLTAADFLEIYVNMVSATATGAVTASVVPLSFSMVRVA